MRNQYIALITFAVILSGALLVSWNAYQGIQSQEKDNRNTIILNAERHSDAFVKKLNLWKSQLIAQGTDYITVYDSLKKGDVAVSKGLPLWPYGNFLSNKELETYISFDNDVTKMDQGLTENTMRNNQTACPTLIRLWLNTQSEKGFSKIGDIENLLRYAEQGDVTQKESINLKDRTWTFKMNVPGIDSSEDKEIWRSVNLPHSLFEFDHAYVNWTAENAGGNVVFESSIVDTPFYWTINDAGKKYIKQPGGQQALYLSLLVSAGVLFYGLFFFLRSNNQLTRQAEQREQLVADISHELRTPVTTLRLYSEMLLDGRIKNDDDKNRYLKNMVRESNRLSRLINNVLDFSRMTRGKLKLNILDISLELFGEDLKYIIEGLDKEKRVEIDFKHDVDFLGDLDATMQVIYNLINNAIKYAKEGKIRVFSEKTDGYLKIIVHDEGPGIPTELKNDLFQPFTRGKDVHKQQIQGSGLGLTVSRSLMETMEGKLTLENSDKGARFVAWFKEAKAEE